MNNSQEAKETYSMGSRFEDFLEEEGILAQVDEVAIKRGLAYQFEQAMKDANVSKAEMAKRMRTNEALVEKVINPDFKEITLNTLAKAATALGMRLKITLETHKNYA